MIESLRNHPVSVRGRVEGAVFTCPGVMPDGTLCGAVHAFRAKVAYRFKCWRCQVVVLLALRVLVCPRSSSYLLATRPLDTILPPEAPMPPDTAAVLPHYPAAALAQRVAEDEGYQHTADPLPSVPVTVWDARSAMHEVVRGRWDEENDQFIPEY